MNKKNEQLQQILDIGIALTAEKNPDELINMIVDTAMNLTGSDAGFLYVIDGDCLAARIMKNKSKGINLGIDGEITDIPSVPMDKKHTCAYAAITKKSVDIENVYESDLFDFSDVKKYDAMADYHTQSMVAIPMINSADEVIGVMQLINPADSEGQIRTLDDEEQRILLALASMTAIALSNMAYLEELTTQMWSFTEALTEAIDARTPYNGSHTRKVAEYAEMIVNQINKKHEEGSEELFFDEDHKDQIVMAALLHDIGKMVVPIEVMNKETRLANYIDAISNRFEKIELLNEIDLYKKHISKEQFDTVRDQLREAKEVVQSVNTSGVTSDELFEKVLMVGEFSFESIEKSECISFFTEEEKACMQIRKGTLTEDERRTMESHVVMTERILSKVYFNNKFKQAPVWASEHHEYIDGTGYPNGMSGEQLGVEARILTVADICDALLATDRPYKKPLPKDEAFVIMEDMAAEGKIDAKLVEYLKRCLM